MGENYDYVPGGNNRKQQNSSRKNKKINACLDSHLHVYEKSRKGLRHVESQEKSRARNSAQNLGRY